MLCCVANPDFYQRRPYLDKLEFIFYPDYASVFGAYRRGEVDGIGRVASRVPDGGRRRTTI